MVGIGTVQLNPSNPRLNEAAVMPVADSIRRFGFRVPIVVNRRTNIIEAGNTRWKAAKKLGMEEIPVVFVEDDDVTAAAYGIADNRTGEIAEWDEPALATILSSLQDVGQLDMTGYGAEDLGELIAGLQAGQEPKEEGAIPEPQEGPTRVQPGEVWALGKHRVMCGDSIDGESVAVVMYEERAVLLATDPPYNVGLDYLGGVDDSKNSEAYEEFTREWFGTGCAFSERQIVTPGCVNLSMWLRLFIPYHVAPWTKTNSMTNGKVSRFWCWEPVLFFGEKWPRTRPNDVFDFPAGTHKDTGGHPCPKPVRMWADLLQEYADPGDTVLDPFLGSGTTMIAAEQTGRVCYGMEILPRYCDVVLARYEKLTGETAERVA